MLTRQQGAGLLGALLAATLLVAGCSQGMVAPRPDDDSRPDETYQPTAIPEDVTDLFEVFGDPDSSTVWIYAQGGPLHMLHPEEYSLFENYPEHRDIRFVQVHQTLTINHDLAEREGDWSLEDLQAEVDVSVEILDRTIEHFKMQDKRVVVVGHSYGAFLVTRYLALKGPEAADQYLLMAGRLDMPLKVVEGFLAGTEYWFPNAVKPEKSPGQDHPLFRRTDRELMEMRIAAATGHDRYTERLAGTDLQRVIYVYGTNDMAVGRLTDPEIAFLESKRSPVIAVQDGGHRSMFEDPDVAKRISDALNE